MEINEEQVRQMLGQSARQMGLLYLSTAKEVIEKYGGEGKSVILKGIKAFGCTRGERIAERVKGAGKPLTLENFFKFYDVPVALTVKQSKEPEVVKHGKLVKKITSCPLAALAKEEGQLEIGKLYCEQDSAMLEGYNPELRFEKTASLMEGDKYCEFVYFTPGKEEEQR